MKKNIVLNAIKFLNKNDGIYKDVEFKDFLLKNFTDTRNLNDRKEMKQFISFLINSNLVKKTSDSVGIEITTEAGIEISRDEISIKLKLTSEGYNLIRENKVHRINNINIFVSLFFGCITIILTFLNFSIKNDVKPKKSCKEYYNDSNLIKYNYLERKKVKREKNINR